jgi:hypothetical protein
MEQLKLTQQIRLNLFSNFYFFSDYLNQHSSKQNIQKDWVKNVLPVS